MLLERVGRGRAVLELTEGPFVDDVGVAGVVKETGRDPWLDTAVRITLRRLCDSEYEPLGQAILLG